MSAHSIRRISLEVNRNGRNGLALMEETSAWANEALIPQIESVFDSLPESTELIRIERLELELNSGASNWREEILARLKRELTGMLLDRIPREKTDLKNKKLHPEESFFENLVYFLQHGVLPWSSTIRSKDDWDEAITGWLSQIDAAGYKSRLVERLADPAVRFRFVHSVSPSALQKTISVFFAVPETTWAGWDADAKVTAKVAGIDSQAVERLVKSLTEKLFETIADYGFRYERSFEVQVVAGVLAPLFRREQIRAGEFESVELASQAFSEARKILIRASSTEEGGLASAFSTPDEAAAGERSPGAPVFRRPIEKRSEDGSVAHLTGESPNAAAEGIYVSDAGVVLLAPFLPTLFERLGVAGNRELMEPGLAMALIHYLATGQETAAEFQLALPKILCGWEMEQPVELPGILPDEMKDEAGQLLTAVIEHWSILKNTSPEGLRESFLQRPGKVTLTAGDEWLLQVEQKPFDMVLQHLPWSFQLIKLSWMNRLLRTEWVY